MSSDPEKPDPAAPTPVEGEGDQPKKVEAPTGLVVPSDGDAPTDAPWPVRDSDVPPSDAAGDSAPSDAPPSTPRAADESGSIDVAKSGRTPAVSGPIDSDRNPEASGSIDIAVSGRNPAASEPSDAPPSTPRRTRRESASIDSEHSPEASGSIDALGGPNPEESGSIDVAMSGRVAAASGPSSRAPDESGSIDVAMSGRNPAMSGSVDVAVSSTNLPQVDADGAPVAIVDPSSAPVSSGAVRAVAARESTGRTKRLTDAAKEATKSAVSGGVTALGTGLGTIGEGVSKLGEKSRKVPLVGSSVSALGESLSSVGESLTELPRVAGTRRGRLLVRSLIVGFVLVFAWIVVIVALQLRGGTSEQIDFRPYAEKILIELSSGPEQIAAVYESASPRFLEFVEKERFIDDMTDLHDTVGKFKEISAVNDTLVTRGPTGRVGRVSLTVSYEKGKTKASVSLHQHEGVWKLLGIGVEIPPEVQITQRQREARVQACKDPMDPKKCDLYVAANTILEQLRDNQGAQIWDAASPIFQKQEEKTRWVQIQRENQVQLGEFRRIIAVTEQRRFTTGNAVYDILVEYARSQGVRVIFGFTRGSKNDPWKLISLKTVVPMPRFDEGEPPKSLGASPTGNPPLPEEPPVDAGVGSAKPAGSAPPPKPKPAPKPKPGSGSATTEGSGSAATGSGSAKLEVKIDPPKVEGTVGSGSAKVDVKVGSGSN